MNWKVAMTVGDYGMINQIRTNERECREAEVDPLEWDVVTMPVLMSVKKALAVIFI